MTLSRYFLLMVASALVGCQGELTHDEAAQPFDVQDGADAGHAYDVHDDAGRPFEDDVDAASEAVGSVVSGLSGGTLDSTTTIDIDRNAVVAVNGCTGTLVAPDVVLTAGHCMPPPSPPVTSEWNTGYDIDVRFGADPADPDLTVTGTALNAPGNDDIVLVGLTGANLIGGRVPLTTARPRPIAFDAPAGLTSSSTLWNVGYGNSTALWPRRWGTSTSYRPFRAARDRNIADNYFCFDDVQGNLVPGDSGSPVLWGGLTGPVMGVYQGNATCKSVFEHSSAPTTGENDGAVMTFGRGNTSGPKPDISTWLQRNTGLSYCARTGSMASQSDGGLHQRLQSWWSNTRLDNFLTTQNGWRGCFTDWDRNYAQGYDFFRFDGWVASPARTQPAGTVPLYLYWNASSLDNATATTATPLAGGWSRGPLLGYVWTSSGTGRVALRVWYSPSRQDYLTTTNTFDYTGSGYLRVGGGGTGIIGYVKTASSLN